MVLGVAGVVLLSLSDEATGTGIAGHVLVLLAGAVWGAYAVGVKRSIQAGHAIGPLAAATFVATGLVLAPTLAFARAPLVWETAWPVAYTATVCTIGAWWLWLWGLRAVGVTASAVALLLEVGVAAALGAALLAEAFPPLKLLGVGLVLAAVCTTLFPAPQRVAPEGAVAP